MDLMILANFSQIFQSKISLIMQFSYIQIGKSKISWADLTIWQIFTIFITAIISGQSYQLKKKHLISDQGWNNSCSAYKRRQRKSRTTENRRYNLQEFYFFLLLFKTFLFPFHSQFPFIPFSSQILQVRRNSKSGQISC